MHTDTQTIKFHFLYEIQKMDKSVIVRITALWNAHQCFRVTSFIFRVNVTVPP